ncbi:Do/DeqQ family serine protease [Saonia flava]|uniref:Do/DeqQ family serine protease n=1 Tax=Saonia flava TaxID=523696 RepID=A0A846QQX3_9FLAO|nr:trypsin-like peptidase domain-containing protein [Saonia flava]NJB70551.1 Do/DeqQ family serine protease [Saonia flava]
MKRIGSLLLVSVFAGAITLGAYKLFFESENYKLVSDEAKTPFQTVSYTSTPSSSRLSDVDFTVAAENTVNAVVHVKNMSINRGSNSIMQFFYGFEESQRPQIGTGSGVIISPDGYIVTNNHVIDRADKLQVTLNNNKTYDAELIGTDSKSDIALLKIDAENNLPYLAFGDSDHAKIGEWVLAVGNPFNLTSTVTAGIVSAKARALGNADHSFIQTDAAVNPGNSGGALVNTNGDLIGINTAITSQTGSYVGYSFAVPSNIAKKVVEDIMEYGTVQKGILGIQSPNVNTQYAVENGINEIDGVYVGNVVEDSGADIAGLKTGDIIKQIDDIKVHKFSDLTGYISSKRPGDKLKVIINRDGDVLTKPVVLSKNKTLEVPVMGFVVKDLSEKDQKKYKTKKGVKIVDVPQKYRGYGLVDKVLISVDEEEIDNIQEAKKVFENINRYERTSITILTEDGERERLIFQ